MAKVVTHAFRNSLRHWIGFLIFFRKLGVHPYRFTPVIKTLRQPKLKDNLISDKTFSYLFSAYI